MLKLRFAVTILPRPELLDPAGDAVQKALLSLGFSDIDDLRIGKTVMISVSGTDGEAIHAAVERMCGELLVNSVIEDYTVTEVDRIG